MDQPCPMWPQEGVAAVRRPGTTERRRAHQNSLGAHNDGDGHSQHHAGAGVGAPLHGVGQHNTAQED